MFRIEINENLPDGTFARRVGCLELHTGEKVIAELTFEELQRRLCPRFSMAMAEHRTTATPIKTTANF